MNLIQQLLQILKKNKLKLDRGASNLMSLQHHINQNSFPKDQDEKSIVIFCIKNNINIANFINILDQLVNSGQVKKVQIMKTVINSNSSVNQIGSVWFPLDYSEYYI